MVLPKHNSWKLFYYLTNNDVWLIYEIIYQYTELLLLDTNFIYLCILHLTLKTIKLQIRLPFI